MSAIAAERGLMRWAASAVVVIGLHAAGATALVAWHDPVGVGDETSAVIIDLSPYVPPSESVEDLPTGPLQQAAPMPAPEQTAERKDDPKPEEKVETKDELEPQEKLQEKVEVSPAPVSPVAALPPDAVKPPPTTEPEAVVAPPPSDIPPAPATTAPPRERHASTIEINKWHTGIVAQIDRHLVYPPAARARAQKGEVQVAFTIDRQGHVVTSNVAQRSGSAELDQAALETLRKAEPFESPPAGLAGNVFTFTIPVRFRLRTR